MPLRVSPSASRRCAARSSSAPLQKPRWPSVCARYRRDAKPGNAPAHRSTGRSRPARSRTSGDRLCRCRRPGRQVSESAEGAGSEPAGRLEGAACARHLPWSWHRRPRWHSCIPGKARSTSTCCEPLRAAEPIVAETFAEADRVMTPLLGKPLSDLSLSTRPIPTPSPRRKKICARPRSLSRPCWPSTSH